MLIDFELFFMDIGLAIAIGLFMALGLFMGFGLFAIIGAGDALI